MYVVIVYLGPERIYRYDIRSLEEALRLIAQRGVKDWFVWRDKKLVAAKQW